MVPTMGKLLMETERPRFLDNFLVAAGELDGRHRGPRWNDGDFYKWFEGAAAIYSMSRDEKLGRQMDQMIELLSRVQRPDGYIHTDIQIRQRNGEDVREFDNPMDFEMYNMGHLMSAAVVHHRATGKTSLLTLARRAADFLDKVFADPTPEQARHGICPSHLMGLVDLYRNTRESRYLKLAERLLNMRDLVSASGKGDDDNQDRLRFREHTTAHGHAVRATYLYAGMADILAETGDLSLMRPMQRVWDDLVSRKLYITGGCGALYDGASPDGTADQKIITRVHQAFGRDYQLPHSTAHNETCAAIGNVLWNWRMFLLTGEARFVDLVEHTLFNSVLAGTSLDGTAFFYTNTLRQLNPMPVELRWPRQRTKFMSCWCCPPNVVRTIAQIGTYAYAVSERGVYVTMYGGSRLDTTLADGSRIKLVQETEYPWDGKVRITVEEASGRELSMFLRIPQWARGATVSAPGGSKSATPQAATFHEVRRRWSGGDVIEIEFPMPARIVEAHPYVEEARNHVAVMRGPIVYCLESSDLPDGVRLLDLYLPATATLELQPLDNPLNVVALRTKALAVSQGDWSKQLYRDIADVVARPVEVPLIPYFAWGNRGPSEMTVWIPAAR
jgi:DUF1680 family protein